RGPPPDRPRPAQPSGRLAAVRGHPHRGDDRRGAPRAGAGRRDRPPGRAAQPSGGGGRLPRRARRGGPLMRIVIAGGGGVGRYLAAQLTRRDHDVVLVERSDEAIAKIPPQLELTVVQGDACAPTVLDRAALREADV